MINLNKQEISSENEIQSDEEIVNQIYDYAATLLFKGNRSGRETKEALIHQGLDVNLATLVVRNLAKVGQKQAKKNILYGTLWCVGGIVATAANIGFIFWGAVVFGAIQFLKGVFQYFKYNKLENENK
jgi:hypothetical protein